MALAWTGDELSREQAQNGVNFDFEVKFDLEGQGQSPKKTIGILTKVFYTYGPNLVILAWTGDELSRGQTWWRTDAGNDNTRRPILASGKKHFSASNTGRPRLDVVNLDWQKRIVNYTISKNQIFERDLEL